MSWIKKFVQSGVCEKKETSDITVNDIFKNLLDRNISKSVIVEQLFSSVGYTKEEILEELNNQVDKPKEYYKQLELNKFYDKLPKETIEFIEFSTKTYQLIDSKKDVYNKNLIITKNDIITLSLYIANYYYKGKISEFYEDNGVNYNKIL